MDGPYTFTRVAIEMGSLVALGVCDQNAQAESICTEKIIYKEQTFKVGLGLVKMIQRGPKLCLIA